jgi:hypothetical protein
VSSSCGQLVKSTQCIMLDLGRLSLSRSLLCQNHMSVKAAKIIIRAGQGVVRLPWIETGVGRSMKTPSMRSHMIVRGGDDEAMVGSRN